eukprot:TRINITY_DN8095_c0_g1_i1.p1 TRINITY_DN8095_c0_g1~~TRINITY_DN8095_c0_g1_i1.p1  ORF type:complete len:196 (-),score=10.99 TRINITY_DN8095_c0_g1_i1:254-841(-)
MRGAVRASRPPPPGGEDWGGCLRRPASCDADSAAAGVAASPAFVQMGRRRWCVCERHQWGETGSGWRRQRRRSSCGQGRWAPGSSPRLEPRGGWRAVARPGWGVASAPLVSAGAADGTPTVGRAVDGRQGVAAVDGGQRLRGLTAASTATAAVAACIRCAAATAPAPPRAGAFLAPPTVATHRSGAACLGCRQEA